MSHLQTQRHRFTIEESWSHTWKSWALSRCRSWSTIGSSASSWMTTSAVSPACSGSTTPIPSLSASPHVLPHSSSLAQWPEWGAGWVASEEQCRWRCLTSLWRETSMQRSSIALIASYWLTTATIIDYNYIMDENSRVQSRENS